jgi:hypothetical protein
MNLANWLSVKFPALDNLRAPWEPQARPAALAWIAFYLLLIVNAAFRGTWLQWADLVFVPIHEGGHLLFGYFGKWIMVFGGTFLQLFVPLALGAYFLWRRQLPGTAFCVFFFFEQWLPIGTYMADARSQSLEYVTVGDPELAEHDWYYLFSRAGLIAHDVQIGGCVRILGWIGMLATVIWFAGRSLQRSSKGSLS